jgi:staphylococcal nuclease domain-containing protein 1
VIEVHSGDSITILNDNNKDQTRYYLASVRAPKYTQKEQQPWGWEAKEYLRKHAVGKAVNVEIEYDKKIPAKPNMDDDDRKPQGDLQMIFVNVILQDKEEKVPNVGT